MDIFQKLNAGGLTIVLVTHEHDISQFAKREIIFRDGHIKRDQRIANPQRATEVLKTLPEVEE
jgi:putative ABC transport system ATP-binding protein